jgi:hypothetical protein
MAVTAAIQRVFNGQPDIVKGDEQDFIRGCADLGSERVDGYRLYEDYYDGRRQQYLSDRQRLYLQRAGVTFAENICAPVVDKLAQRLHVEGFQVEDNEDASAWLSTTVFPHSGGDELQGVIHTRTAMLADCFVIVDWDPQAGLPRYRYNHPGKIKMVYDEDAGPLAEPAYAVKKWASTAPGMLNPGRMLIWRLNLYYPDRVEKWFSADRDGDVWGRWTEEGELWPVPWVDGMGEPLGVPVVHFRNKALGDCYGRSEVRAAIPYQEEHTKNVLDLFTVMDQQGWQIITATGIAEADTLKLAVGDILRSPNESASFGLLPAADPAKLLDPVKGTLQRFSAFTDTPLHSVMLTGSLPSGESLKTYDAGAVKKAVDRQPSLGNSWARVQSLCLRLAAVHGDVGFEFDPSQQVTVVWDSAETRDEAVEAQNALIKSELGVSNATLLRELGYDPEQEAAQRVLEAPDTPVLAPGLRQLSVGD